MTLTKKSKSAEGENARGSTASSGDQDLEKHGREGSHPPVRYITARVFFMAVLVSMGGLIFGYDTGSIGGYLAMPSFLNRFGDVTKADGIKAFSNGRSGTIVGLFSIGTLLGALLAAPIADRFGRKISITFWNLVFIVGVVVQITTTDKWYQVASGRCISGLGVGGLSVLTPMYQAETAPRQVRGALISAYQLFITLGILIAYCINYGVAQNTSTYSWRITMGIGFAWPAIMGSCILLFRESPRWDYGKDNIDRARTTIAKTYGVTEDHPEVVREMHEIKEKHDAEKVDGGKHPWHEVFTAPTMLRRVCVGVTIQMLQQLTGANFFFYFGTIVFTATGLNNSFVTSITLGAVNFACTFLGLWVVQKLGRRTGLIVGALWMFACFIVFASVGHFSLDRITPSNTPVAGKVMIVVACLFIAAFASTWGPLAWTVCGEIYPTRYRAKGMALATASNWTWNFLISFFTPFITAKIDYLYGYVFAAMCLTAAVFVYFFVSESQGRTLEEIDTMYLFEVKPWKSAKWRPTVGEREPTLDSTYLAPGGREIIKLQSPPVGAEQVQW